MSNIAFDILGIGLLGPGLADWASGAPLLREPARWQSQTTQVPAPQRLPATERRRAGAVVKASVVVADQACAAAGVEAASVATVFASSTGEPANCHALCEALAAPERLVSPTRFTNSVHNAAGGYWHIAVHGMQPSTSLSAFDGSFGAGLLEAAAQCQATQAPVLLVACDVPYPEPLHAKRSVSDVFAVAFVVGPRAGAAPGIPRLAGISLQLAAESPLTPCAPSALENLRAGIPAARSLPLLQALAAGRPATVCIEGLPGMVLQIEVDPG
jgi:hypothetical protein